MDLSTLLATAPPASARHSMPLSAASSAAQSPIVSRRNSAISAVSSRRSSARAGEMRQFSVTVSPATDHVAEAAAAAAAAAAALPSASASPAAESASSTRSSSPHMLQIHLPSSPPADGSAATTSHPTSTIVVSPPSTASASHRRNRSAAMSLPPDVPLAAAAAAASTTVTAAAASSSVRTAPVSSRSSLTVAAPPTRRSSMPRGSSFLSSAAGRITPSAAAAPATPPLSALGSTPKSRPSSALSIPSAPGMASSSSSSSLHTGAAAATASSVAHRRVASSMTPAAAAASAATASSAQKRPTTVKVPSTTHRPASARTASLAAASAKAAAATAAAAAAAKALAAAKAASFSIAPTTNDYSLLLQSPMGRATTTASPFMRPRSATTAGAAAATVSASRTSRPASAAPAVPLSASSLLPRSASFGSLSTAAVPAWLLAETLSRTDAQRQFEVTALQAEKAALEAQLEEARLTISDLRYQGYRKDAAADVRVARHLELQRAAERARDHWGARYLWARRVIHAHKVLLLHVGLQTFLRAYMSKRNLLGLAESMRGLVAVIDRSKDEGSRDLSDRLKAPLPQAETRAFVEDGRALWHSVVRTPSSVLLQNLQDGLLSLRTSLLSTLAIKRTVSHTIESMFARNQELVATNLALREDLDALTPECNANGTSSPQLWKRPGLLRAVLRRMELEERESARTAAAEAVRVQRELELKAILAPNIAATRRSRRTIGGQGWASQVYVEAAEAPFASAAGAADRPISAVAAGRFTPKPPSTAAASNGLSSSARSHGSPSHFVARPMPRTSAVAKVELSSKGIAYRHAPTRANKQQMQQQRQAEPPAPEPLPPPLPPLTTDEAEWSPPQPSWARHFRHPSFSGHRIGHTRTTSSVMQTQQQRSEEKTQNAALSAAAPVPPPRSAPSVPPHKRSILDVPDDALADADDQMMLGWRDDDSEDEATQARGGTRATREASQASSARFQGPNRGLARFRSAVARVLSAQRSKYRSMKGALHELKHMDLANMHLDPEVD